MRANLRQDRDKLSCSEHRWCAAPHIDGLNGAAWGYMLLCRQSDLMKERSHEGRGAPLAINFEVEGAEIASLSAERDVKVQTKGRGCHDERLNP